MEREKIKVSEDISIEAYSFSDYITCIDVYYKDESFSAFCTDTDLVNEWRENPELLLEVVKERIAKQTPIRKQEKDSAQRIKLNAELEVETYSFSGDVYCVNVFQKDKLISSFCTDVATYDEWQEDQELLEAMVKQVLREDHKD